MLWLPQKGCLDVITNGGIVGTATPGTGVPSHATVANSDGAVTEILAAASNTRDSWGIGVYISGTGASATASQGKLSILIGGATDDVLIPDLICGHGVLGASGTYYFFPLHVPGGVRLAAMFNSVRTAITCRVLIWLYSGAHPMFRVGSKVDVLGTEISGSRGKAVVPTASGGGASVTEMEASTAYDYFAFNPGFQPATDTTITPAGHVNIGIGVGASTEQRIGTWWYGKDTGENLIGPMPHTPAFCDIPAGSRISLLASNSGANDAAYDGHIYAVR